MTRRIVILGSTGSIGTQALEVVEHLNALAGRGGGDLPGESGGEPAFEVVGLCAGKNALLLAQQARRFRGVKVALGDCDSAGSELPDELRGALRGRDAAEALVRETRPDVVVAAMVGVAGLPATLAAVELGCDVALANKETLVAAGSLVLDRIRNSAPERRARLLPVDSEHSAVWQCVMGAGLHGAVFGGVDVPRRARGSRGSDGAIESSGRAEAARRSPPWGDDDAIARVTLTASGGPFREWSVERIARATREEALRHPTWSMGGKITIDSATLMNKALEVIEAHWLFGLPPEKLGIVVHPQSVVHAMVETCDGSVLCQMGTPDMRSAIQYALKGGVRACGLAARLEPARLGTMTFEEPDAAKFPAVDTWRACISSEARGTTAGAILNAANEVAVGRFLDRDKPALAFPRIAEVALAALASVRARPAASLADVLAADGEGREFAGRVLSYGK
jgi:1-deoxy-D-xylulose-5-phosphate reductoisomerase